MIIHNPSLDIYHIEKAYTKKDGVPVRYVCTTEINANNIPCDVFFRETPHPEFGNRYFAIGLTRTGAFICNADEVEEYSFSMISNNNGDLFYSRNRWDMVHVDDNFVDGGRAYTRTNARTYIYKIKDGEFYEIYN